jgi:hypothetical protein
VPVKEAVLFSIEVFQALLTPMIGITTAYIAWQQYRLAHDRERHERYDRRLKIFSKAMEFVSDACRTGNVSTEQLHSLLRETSEAKFLVASEAEEFIEKLYKNGVELQALNSQLDSSKSPQSQDLRAHLGEKLKELIQWFGGQFDEGRRVFERDLSLREK